MTDLRVLHVLEAVGGGTSRHLLDVVTHVKGISHEVAMPTRRLGWLTDEALPRRLALAGAMVHLVQMRRRPLNGYNAVAVLRLRRLVRERRHNIVHGHSAIGGAIGRVVAASCGVQAIYSPHGVAPGRLVRVIERALGSITDYWVADSASEGELATESGFVGPDKLRIIPNGIDLTAQGVASTLRDVLCVEHDVPLIGTIARLDYQKDPLTFVELCARVSAESSASHFVLIGNGRMQRQVLAAAGTLIPPGRFHYLPDLTHVVNPLEALTVFVSTSRYEGGAYTPLDAMYAGVPVVLSDCVGNRDVGTNEVDVLMFATGDAAAGARAVLRVLADSGLRAQMAAAGAHRLRSAFDVRMTADRLENLYREAAAKSFARQLQ